jgi:hypothetical protein
MKDPFARPQSKGMPWWLLFVLIVVAFIGNLVYGYYSARNSGTRIAESLYTALRDSDDDAVNARVTGFALKRLQELEEKYGKVQSFEITRVGAEPADAWYVELKVKRARAETNEEVTNMFSGNVVKFVYGEPILK